MPDFIIGGEGTSTSSSTSTSLPPTSTPTVASSPDSTPGPVYGASFRGLVNREGSLPHSHSPSTVTWSAGGTSKLIEVTGGDARGLLFDGVYLNGLCSLRRLEVRNVSKGVVLVRLGSTLGDQLQYQLTNFNLDLLPTELRHLATNTSTAAAQLGDLPESNALFDSVGFVREITLQPGQTREIVVSFRPDSTHAVPALLPPANDLPHDAQSEQGVSSISIAEDSNLSSSIGARWSDNSATNTKQYDVVSIDGFLNFDASLLSTSKEVPSEHQAPVAFQQLSLELHATCCRSLFALSVAKDNDPSEVFIDWGNQCVIGELYTRDFELVNRSGIELFWRLEDPAGIATGRNPSAPFLVADKDKGHWLGAAGSEWPRPQSLAPHATRRLRFIFRPTTTGEVDAEFSFENMSDLDNTVSIHFHASVTSAPRDDNLRLLSGTSIDYGDCCTGEWSQQVIVFKNVAEHPLEVSFAGDKAHEVTFKLEVAGDLDSNRRLSILDSSNTIDANSEQAPTSTSSKTSSRSLQLPLTEVAAPSSHSRTIISELARGTTLPSLPPLRGSSLLVGAQRYPHPHPHHPPPSLSTGVEPSISSNQSESNFSASGVASSPSSSDFAESYASPTGQSDTSSRPRTYLPGGPVSALRDTRSPLGLDSTTFADESDSAPPSRTSLRATFEEPESEGAISAAEMLPSFSTRPTTSRSESSEGGLYRVQDHFNRLKASNASSIEDIYAKPGVESRIVVSYRAARAASLELEPDAGRLVKKTFKLTVSYRPWGVRGSASTVAKERKTIICKARVCTSFIDIKPKVMDFGEVELGTSVQGMLAITNLSDIMARVDLRFISKVLSAYRDEIEIEPHKTVDVRLDMVPRRTNPSYQKQVSCHNLRNPSNSQVCLVKSVNVDTRGVAYHSRFYKLLTPTGGNFVEFGKVPVHSNALRAITIQNNSQSTLSLELSSAHPEDHEVFVRPVPTTDNTAPPSLNGTASQSGTPPSSPKPPAPTATRRIEAHGELKERVLEAIFQPATPAVTHQRTESTTSSTNQSETSIRSAINRLKDGAKAKATLTQPYGVGVAFKDRTLLSNSEYLDLASGPPLDARRTSPRGKRTMELEKIVRSSSRPRPSKLDFQTSPKSPTMPEVKEKTPTPPTTSPVKRKTTRTDASVSTSPALTARRRIRGTFPLPSDPSQLSLEESLTACEHHSGHPDSSELSTWELEDAYVRRFIQLRRTVQNAIAAGELVSAAKIDVAPGAERTVYIMVHPAGTRGGVQGTSRKQDGKILIRLCPPEAEEDPLLPASEIPLREVVLRWTTCRSMMELGMAHINFGQLDRGSSKEKKILIQNGSDTPLLYSVRKSGSIASGNIRVTEGRHGIIAGYGKREVTIVFEPRFAGSFEEVIHIDAVEDESEGQTVRLKAFIRRPPTFAVAPTTLNFGDLELFKSSPPQTFTVTNTTKSSRSFAVTLDDAAFFFSRSVLAVILDASEGITLPSLTTEEEEEVEGVLQKLKISRRKGQPDKEEKYVARLQLLGVPVPMNDPAASTAATPSTTPPKAIEAVALPNPPTITSTTAPALNGDSMPPPPLPSKTTVKKELTSSSITFTLNANSRRDISIVVIPTPILPALDDGKMHEDITASLTVSENADYKVSVSVSAKIILSCA